jgi:hypothetical protein
MITELNWRSMCFLAKVMSLSTHRILFQSGMNPVVEFIVETLIKIRQDVKRLASPKHSDLEPDCFLVKADENSTSECRLIV